MNEIVKGGTRLAILTNFPLAAAFISILLAQVVKVPLHYIKAGTWEWKLALSTGGMPSSHSAAVASLATAIGIDEGAASAYFAISVVVAAIIMFDAFGIRRQAGEQAVIINQLTKEFNDLFHKDRAQAGNVERKVLKELLGHRPIEVAAGCLFGIAVSEVMYLLWF